MESLPIVATLRMNSMPIARIALLFVAAGAPWSAGTAVPGEIIARQDAGRDIAERVGARLPSPMLAQTEQQAVRSGVETSTAVAAPTLPVLDDFNRADADSLGANWQQATLTGMAVIRITGGAAGAINLLGIPSEAIWNVPEQGFGASQGASFTFRNKPVDGSGLILKASGAATLAVPANFIRVTYGAGQVSIATTVHHGGNLANRAAFAASFGTGDSLVALADAGGKVSAFKSSGATTTLLGSVIIPASGPAAWRFATGGGRVGIHLPAHAEIDNFSGGAVP